MYVNASVDVQLSTTNASAAAFLRVRVTSNAIFFQLTNPDGIWLSVNASGWSISTGLDTNATLASGVIPKQHVQPDSWLRLSLSIGDGNLLQAEINEQCCVSIH